jgi:hypothetical protein
VSIRTIFVQTSVNTGSGSERTFLNTRCLRKSAVKTKKAEKGNGHVLMHRSSVWSPVCDFVFELSNRYGTLIA